jgi:hypothetical protein
MQGTIKIIQNISHTGPLQWKFPNLIQAGLLLCHLFLCDFYVMRLEKLHHFSNSWNSYWFNTIWHRRSVVPFIFHRALERSDITVTRMDWLHWWPKHIAHVPSSSTSLAFLINMGEKKITSPSVIYVKNWWNTARTEVRLDTIRQLEKGEKMFKYAVMLDSLAIAYVKFVTMLTELKKMLSQELKCLCRKTYQNELYQKQWDVCVLHF